MSEGDERTQHTGREAAGVAGGAAKEAAAEAAAAAPEVPSVPPAPPLPWRPSTLELARRTLVVTVTVIAVLVVAYLLVQLRGVLLWALIGIVLSVALQPAVTWLVRRGWHRLVAALLVSFLTVAAVVAAALAVAVPVVLQTAEFIDDLPQIVNDVFGPGGNLHFLEERFQVLERLADITPDDVWRVAAGNRDTILDLVGGAASFVAGTVTVVTIMVMLLIEGPRAWGAVLGVLSVEERAWAERIGDNFLRAVGGYVRGNLTISVVAGLASYVVLKILDVPYAETLAVLVALLDIIPLVGATIAAVIVVIVGFASGGLTDGIVLTVFFVLYQQLENNVLQNLVYSKTVSLSPLVVFLAALVGASLGGIVGVLLAIPLTSAGWVLARDLLELRRARRNVAATPEAGGLG